MEESLLNTPIIDPLSTPPQAKTIFESAATGDIEVLKWWIEVQRQPLDTKDQYNRTSLIWAVLKGQIDVFHYLISQSQTAQQLEAMGGKEALTLAIYQGHWEIVRTLLSEKGLSWQSCVEVSTLIEQKELDVRQNLVRALGDQDSDVRQAAACALGQLKEQVQANPTVVDALVQVLKDKVLCVRQEAAQALGQLKEQVQANPTVVDALVKTLGDQDPNVQNAAIQALVQLSQINPTVVDALIHALEDNSSNNSWIFPYGVARVLGQLKEQAQANPAVIDALAKALGDKDNSPYGQIHQAAAQALGQLKEQVQTNPVVITALVKALRNKESSLACQAAAQALVQLGQANPVGIDALVQALEDKSESVRRMAVQALGQLKEQIQTHPAIVDALVKALEDQGSSYIRQRAAHALGQLKEQVQDNPVVVDALVNALGDTYSNVLQEVMQALNQFTERLQASPTVVGALLKALGNQNSSDVCKGAVQAFVQIGQTNSSVVDTLIQTLEDQRFSSARRWVVQVLGQLKEQAQANPAVVDALVKALEDKSESVRQGAARALGQLKEQAQAHPMVINALIKLLGDQNSDVHPAAVQALVQIGQVNTEVVDVLVKVLEDKDNRLYWQVGSAATRALGQLKEQVQANFTAVDALVKALEDKHPNVRQGAAHALGQLKEQVQTNPKVVGALVQALEDKSEGVQNAAVQALGQLEEQIQVSPAVIDALVKALEHKTAEVRKGAARALGQLKEQVQTNPMVINALIKLLGDEVYLVHPAAVQALVQLGQVNPTVVDALVKALGDNSSNNSWIVHYGAAQVLGQLKDQIQPKSMVVDALVKALEDQNSSSVCQAAAQALGQLKEQVQVNPTVIEALVKTSGNKSEHVRQAAVQALGQLKDQVQANPVVVDALLKALGDKLENVRQTAALALGQLKDQVQSSPAVIGALVKALGDQDSSSARQAAAQALGQLSEPMKHLRQSLPILKQGLIQVLGDSGDDCPELPMTADKSVFMLMVRLLVRHGKQDYLLKHWRNCELYLQQMDGEKGNTGLHEAAKYNQWEMIELLLGRGIVDKLNQIGESASDVALKAGAWEAAQALVGLKAKVVAEQSVAKSYQPDGKAQVLGSGAFGTVYKAHWNNNTPVAYKQLHVGAGQLSAEFKSEVNLLATNPHPNIVTVYAVTLLPLGLVMEWMPKGSLRLVLDEQAAGKVSLFNWSQKITLAQDMAKGLTFLHDPSINLLHRDLKADNVLLDDRYHAKLTDFGFAQGKQGMSAEPQAVVGSLAWLAPEALSEAPQQTRASDIYSYGTVLWELTTQQEPYQGLLPEVIKAQIVSGKSLALPSDTPLAWIQLIQDCWQITPDKRPLASNVAQYLVKHRNDIDVTAEKDNAAVAHFKGLDEAGKEQLQSHVGYTPKTLRYLLPMLENTARFILYVADIHVDLVDMIESLSLLSAALGRPAAFLLPSFDDKAGVVAGLLFGQRLVWIDPEGKGPMPEQQKSLHTLSSRGVLTQVYQSCEAFGVLPDREPHFAFAPASSVLLIEWLRGILQRPLARILQWSEQLPPNSPFCSLADLQSPALQTLQVQTSLEASQAHLGLLRQQHLVVLQVQPKEATVRQKSQFTEADYLKHCWNSTAQMLAIQLMDWVTANHSPFRQRLKELRSENLKTDLKQSIEKLTQELDESNVEKLTVISASELVLLKVLGAGNFGEVHQALWHQTPVAIKRLKGEMLPPKLQVEFEHESALLASLNHPNVVRLYGICKDYEGYPLCMVLEFAAGGALDSQLQTHSLPWATRQRIALDIARGVDYLHQRQIIHGDLRACNILMGKDDTAKVGDFGLAKQRVANMSMVMTNERTFGVLPWLSLELLKNGVRTKASDVYSFGMILWEIMTGTSPFPKHKLEAKELLNILERNELWNSRYHAIPDDAPAWWVTLMKACCQPEAEKRIKISEVVECLLSEVEPHIYTAYAEKRGIANISNAPLSAIEQRSRDIVRCSQQFESPVEQFTRQIRDCLKQNDLSIGMSYVNALLTETQALFRNALLPLRTSEQSMQLFTRFFSVGEIEGEGVPNEQGSRIAGYLTRSGRETMACVNKGFNRFFSQLPAEDSDVPTVEELEYEEVVVGNSVYQMNT